MATEQEYPKLTHAMLTMLMSKPYGPAALTLVQERNWDALQQLTAATADWTHHCVICGVYCNRPQDLNLHLRTQHPNIAATRDVQGQSTRTRSSIKLPLPILQQDVSQSASMPHHGSSSLVIGQH